MTANGNANPARVTSGTISAAQHYTLVPSYGNSPITIVKQLSEKDFSFVELSVDLTVLTGEPRRIKVTGFAKRNPVDKPNKELSDALAMARAFLSLNKRLERRAAGLIKQQDDVLAMKEAAKEAAKPKRRRR